MPELICPNHERTLARCTIESAAIRLEIWQCQDDCGMVWFRDFDSIYASRRPAVGAALDVAIFKSIVKLSADLRLCPVDGILMRKLVSEHLPADLQVERCDRCGGLYLNYARPIRHRQGIRVGSFLTPRPIESGWQMGDYLTARLARFASAPTVDYQNMLAVSPADFSAEHFVPLPGRQTVVEMLAEALFDIKHRAGSMRSFSQRVLARA